MREPADDMRPASTRMAAILMSIAAAVLGACGNSGNESTQSTEQVAPAPNSLAPPSSGSNGSYQPEDQPIYRLLFDRLGVSSGELRELANRSRLDAYLACMAGRGFDMPADGAVPIVRLPAPSYSPVDDAVAQIRAQEAMAGVDIPEQQMGACLTDVDSINPFNDLFALVEQQTSAVSDRVRSDERYNAAREQSSTCAADTPPSDGRRDVSERVTTVMNSYTSGEVDAQAALGELERLRQAAAQIDWSIDGGCDESIMAVERQLVSEYQQEFLDENPGFIDGIVERFQPIVDQYLPG